MDIHQLGGRGVSQSEDLYRFLGYGPPQAELVFIGLEEGGDNTQGDAGRAEFEDLGDFHALRGQSLSKTAATWPREAVFALSLLAGNWHPTSREVRHYRMTLLGRKDGRTLIANLSPYRRPRLTHPSATVRDRAAEGQRLVRLQSHLRKTKPSYVICFGAREWPHFQELLGMSPVSWSAGVVGGAHPEVCIGSTEWRGVAALTPFLGQGGLLSYDAILKTARLMQQHRRI
jgi:hypothetical protein